MHTPQHTVASNADESSRFHMLPSLSRIPCEGAKPSWSQALASLSRGCCDGSPVGRRLRGAASPGEPTRDEDGGGMQNGEPRAGRVWDSAAGCGDCPGSLSLLSAFRSPLDRLAELTSSLPEWFDSDSLDIFVTGFNCNFDARVGNAKCMKVATKDC